MKKKVKFSEPRPDFLLLGLVSPEKGYRLCFHINTHGFLNLSKGTPIEVPVSGSEKIFFNRYERSNQTEEEKTVYIVSNRQDGNYFLPDYKNVDYIMVINGPDKETKAAELKKDLISVPSIQAIFVLELDKIKSNNYLYLE